MAQRFFRIINKKDLTFVEKVKLCLIGIFSGEKKKVYTCKFIFFEYALCYMYKDDI